MPPALAATPESPHESRPPESARRRVAGLAIAALLCLAPGRAGAAWTTLTVGGGKVAVLASRDWSRPQPAVTRAVITIHGLHRDAGHSDAVAREARALAGRDGLGTLLLTPRFAGAPHASDPAGLLRWPGDTWMDGEPASGPWTAKRMPISSFAVMDALLARLSDRRLFPALATVVLVGHSAGGQFVQRYAMLGHPAAGPALRYVVANPSSYAYPDRDRPGSGGGQAPGPAAACPGYDRWKYGLEALPAYAGGASADALAQAYAGRDVTYLLGGRDDDPALAVLDRSCAAEAQGPTHLARGRAFVRLLHARYPAARRQSLHEIAGIGHDAAGMLTSACALAAIYDAPPCGGQPPDGADP